MGSNATSRTNARGTRRNVVTVSVLPQADAIATEDNRSAVIETVQKFFRGPNRSLFEAAPITWFATMTFRNARATAQGVPSALKSWLRLLNQRNPESRCTSVCWSVELQKRGTAHIHALLAGGRQMSHGHCNRCIAELPCRSDGYRILKESWFHHFGIARFQPYDDSIGRGGMTYVLKYILSDECEGWGLWEAGKEI